MVKLSLLIVFTTIFAPPVPVLSQQISYSAGTILEKSELNILQPQAIGHHIHFWQLHPSKKMELSLFDTGFRKLAYIKAPIPVSSATQVTFLKFNDFYYLHTTYPQSNDKPFEIFKVSSSGDIQDVTKTFEGLLTDTTALLKKFSIIKTERRLLLLSMLVIPVEKKGIIVIRPADSLLNKQEESRISFEFDAGTETIQQLHMYNDSIMYIIKATKQGKYSDELTLYKININTKKLISVTYSSDEFLFFAPAIHPDASGNGLWLLAYTMHILNREKKTYIVKIFMQRLNDSLAEIATGKLININAPLRSDGGKALTKEYRPFTLQPSAYNGFILLSTERPEFEGGNIASTRVRYSGPRFNNSPLQDGDAVFSGPNKVQTNFLYPQAAIDNVRSNLFYEPVINSMRFTWIDNQVNTRQDTIIKNDIPQTDISFTQGLILEERDRLRILYPVKIRRKRNGIMRYTADKNNGVSEQLMITDPELEHLLGKSIVLNSRTYIFPYRKGNRFGLAKLRF